MDYRSMFNRDYIGAWDLPRDATVTIARVEAGVLTSQGGKKDKKPIIYFQGKEKGFVCNKTNAKTIAAMYGNDTAKWVGQAITIYATKTQVGAETVDCIRVRVTRPKSNGKAAAPPPDEADSPPPDDVVLEGEETADAAH